MITLRKSIAGGYQVVHEDDLDAGHLMVVETYQAITAETAEPAGAWCTHREAWLDGVLITDPARAQQLADAAGVTTPGGIV